MYSITNNTYITNPVRVVKGGVVVGTTTYTEADSLISIDVDRVADNEKFFGSVVTNKVNFHLRDVNREIEIETGTSFKPYLAVFPIDGDVELSDVQVNFPTCKITEINRDESNNELSLTAYDYLGTSAKELTFADLSLTAPYTVYDVLNAISVQLTTSSPLLVGIESTDYFLTLSYADGANFDGGETLWDILEDIAEVTQGFIYIDGDDKLTLKRNAVGKSADWTVDRENYFDLDTKTNRRLVGVASTTDLGDNVSSVGTAEGTTQLINDNGFLTLRDDLATILDTMLDNVYQMTYNQFELDWRGNPQLEVGDIIAYVDKGGNTVTSILLDDSISYDGGLTEKTQWEYPAEDETDTNSTTLGEALLKTSARVDKANQNITMLISSKEETDNQVSTIQMNLNSIDASVSSQKEEVDSLSEELNTVKTSVSAQLTSEDVQILINNSMENGVSAVNTGTGFTFNSDGLTINKDNSAIQTNINENGMVITQGETEMLKVYDEGVEAINLTASKYLIVGSNSRFEDYNNGTRTGCFWIGG